MLVHQLSLLSQQNTWNSIYLFFCIKQQPLIKKYLCRG